MSIYISPSLYIYIYIYMCVCVCVYRASSAAPYACSRSMNLWCMNT